MYLASAFMPVVVLEFTFVGSYPFIFITISNFFWYFDYLIYFIILIGFFFLYTLSIILYFLSYSFFPFCFIWTTLKCFYLFIFNWGSIENDFLSLKLEVRFLYILLFLNFSCRIAVICYCYCNSIFIRLGYRKDI